MLDIENNCKSSKATNIEAMPLVRLKELPGLLDMRDSFKLVNTCNWGIIADNPGITF
jgi:hypothetical protein